MLYAYLLQGVLLITPEVLPDGATGNQKLTRLWIHEVYRVFYDRLVDDEDRELFFEMCQNVVTKQFKVFAWSCLLSLPSNHCL